MSDSPRVTIITPTYNRADLLPETIASVLAQDFSDFEYLILDDGSVDDTVERVLKPQTDPRIRWERHPNMGEARTVNKGFALARGEYVAVINSDDPVRPGWLRAMVDVLDAHPEVLVAYPDFDMIDEEGRVVRHRPTHDYSYRDMIVWNSSQVGPGALIRRRAIEQAGPRDPSLRYVSDYDLWLRIGLYGPLLRVPQTLATWRTHAGGTSAQTQRSPAYAAEHIRVVAQIYARKDLPPEVLAYRREALSRAYYRAGLMTMWTARWQSRGYFVRAFLLYPSLTRSYPLLRRHPRDLLRMLLPAAVDKALLRWWLRRKGIEPAADV